MSVFKDSGSVRSSGYMYYVYLDMVGSASSELWSSRQFTWSNYNYLNNIKYVTKVAFRYYKKENTIFVAQLNAIFHCCLDVFYGLVTLMGTVMLILSYYKGLKFVWLSNQVLA